MEIKVTGKATQVKHGLVDYEAEGYIIKDGERIPCRIGYTDFSFGVVATHLFIDDGITESGTHYYKETIEL